MGFPTFTVELAAGQTPKTALGSLVWTEIGNGLLGFTMKRGRQDNTARFEAGQCTLTFDNRALPSEANHLDENDSSSLIGDLDGAPGTPIRVTATWDGSDYVLFRGFTLSGWVPEGQRHRARTVTVTCTDLLGWHQQTILPSSRFGCWAMANEPLVYFDGRMARTLPIDDDFVVNAGSLGDGHYFTDAGFSSDLVQVPSIVPGSGTGSFLWASTADVDGITADDAASQSAEVEVVVWFQNSNDSGGVTPMTLYNVTNSTEGAGGTVVGGSLGATDEVTATIALPTGGGTFTATTSAADSFRDGNTHLARVLYEASSGTSGNRRIRLFTDLDNASTTGLTQRATIGGGYVGVSDFGTADPVGVVGDLAYFDHFTDGDFFTFGLDEAAAGRDLLWAGDTIEERIEHAFAAAQIPMPTLVVEDVPAADLDQIVPGRSLTETCHAAAAAFGGGVYVTRDGELRAHNYSGFYTESGVTKATVYFMRDSAPITGFWFQYIKSTRTGTRLDRIINEAAITCSAVQSSGFTSSYQDGADYNLTGTVTARDSASIDRYSTKSFSYSSEASNDDDLVAWAQWLVDNFKDPPIEVGDIVLKPVFHGRDSSDTYLATWLFEELEIGTPIFYRDEYADGSAAVADGEFVVDSEQWSYKGGTDLTVTVRISPNFEAV